MNDALFVFGLGSTIRQNTNSLFGPLFGAEANTKRIFGTALIQTSVLLGEKSLIYLQKWQLSLWLCYSALLLLADADETVTDVSNI